MRKFKYYDLDGEHDISEHEIILTYWVYWSTEVFRRRPDNTFLITPDNCIDDFCAVNWAEEILDEV